MNEPDGRFSVGKYQSIREAYQREVKPAPAKFHLVIHHWLGTYLVWLTVRVWHTTWSPHFVLWKHLLGVSSTDQKV